MSPQDNRTEKATPKKREDARKKGQVLKSIEVNTAAMIILLLSVLHIFLPLMMEQMTALYIHFLSNAAIMGDVFSIRYAANAFLVSILRFLLVLAPLFGFAVLGGIVVNYAQVGFLFSTKALAPKMNRINPLEGFKRIFSIRTLAELIKSLAKVAIVGILAYNDLRELIEQLPNLMGNDLLLTFSTILTLAYGICIKIAIALAAFAAADYLYQWWRFEKDLMMTKQEVKDEYKIMEGDPKVKGRIRQKQREMSMMRMMQAVPEADVIITNPTHYAVALKYDEIKGDAPIVLAKGKDFIAQRIKEIAAEHAVEMVENKPLAQSLFAYCEVGDAIPEELYQAVAEVLAYVYKLRNAAGGRR